MGDMVRQRLPGALHRAAVVPFEVAVGLLLLFSGLTAMFHVGLIDPVTALLPDWEAILLNVMTTLCGALIIAGVILAVGAAEAAGLLFLLGVVAARFLLYGHYLSYGANFVLTGVLDATIIGAAVVRLITLRQRKSIILADDTDPASRA